MGREDKDYEWIELIASSPPRGRVSLDGCVVGRREEKFEGRKRKGK